MTQAFYQFHRVTRGAAGEFTFQPNADNRWYARYLYSGYVEDVNRNRWDFRAAGTPTQNADGSITSGIRQFDKTLRDMKERVDLNVGEIGGEELRRVAGLSGDLENAVDARSCRKPSYSPKKNALLRTIGPPRTPPN